MKNNLKLKSTGTNCFIAVLLLIFCTNVAKAQHSNKSKDTTLPNDISGKDFTVTSEYTPTIRQSSKINFKATSTLPSPPKVPLSYNVPSQSLTFIYSPSFLQPLAVNIDTASVWRNANFVKLGYGNYATPYLEGAFSLGDGFHSAVTLHAKHTSSKGDLPLQQFSTTGIDANGVFAFGEKNELDARIYYGNAGQYEYAGLMPNVSYDKDSLRRRYHDIGLKVGLSNKIKNTSSIDYHPSIAIDAFGGNRDERESTLTLDVPLEKRLNETFKAKLGAKLSVSSYKSDTVSINNTLIAISPAIQIDRPNFKLNVGVTPTFDNASFHLLPDLTLEAKIRDKPFVALAGWKGYYNQNTYRSLTDFNPWIKLPGDILNTRVNEVYGGFRGSAGDHFTYNAKASFINYHNMPLYLNDATGSNTFAVVNEASMNNLRLHGELGYNAKQNFSLLAGFTMNNYGGLDDNAKPWGLVPIDLNASLRWTVAKSVLLKSDLSIFNGAYYLDASSQPKRLSGAVDWSLGTEVSVIKNLSLWLQVNNLLNSKYQRWNGYRTLGMNIVGGIIFNFGQLEK